MSSARVLIVEDDKAIADVIAYNLENNGYEVLRATTGREGLRLALENRPELIILDVMLPEMDGLEVCRHLRADPRTGTLRVLMLTAKSEENDQLSGFNVGADDYVVKPFSVRVLLERVKSQVRRAAAAELAELPTILTCGAITMDRDKYSLLVDNEPVSLTATEFRLLESMVRQPGRVFERTELIEHAMGTDTIVLERTIDVHVRSIRKKLGTAADYLETVRGVGYRIQTPE